MSKIYNFEDVKKIQFNIQNVFKVLEKSICETINKYNKKNMDYFIKMLSYNLLEITTDNNKIIYNTKISYSLKIHEIILYAILAYYDLKDITIDGFITQFEKEVLSYSVLDAEQRVKYLQTNKKIK